MFKVPLLGCNRTIDHFEESRRHVRSKQRIAYWPIQNVSEIQVYTSWDEFMPQDAKCKMLYKYNCALHTLVFD